MLSGEPKELSTVESPKLGDGATFLWHFVAPFNLIFPASEIAHKYEFSEMVRSICDFTQAAISVVTIGILLAYWVKLRRYLARFSFGGVGGETELFISITDKMRSILRSPAIKVSIKVAYDPDGKRRRINHAMDTTVYSSIIRSGISQRVEDDLAEIFLAVNVGQAFLLGNEEHMELRTIAVEISDQGKNKVLFETTLRYRLPWNNMEKVDKVDMDKVDTVRR